VDDHKSTVTERIISSAGDPFPAAARRRATSSAFATRPFAVAARRPRTPECPSCFGGYVTVTYEEDGQEHDEAIPCRRCGGFAS
jgi:hypothetical protein